MIPAYFEFVHAVKMCAGRLALDHLSYECEQLDMTRPFLVSDPSLAQLGFVKQVEALVPVAGVFTDVPRDSSTTVVEKMAQKYREAGCDSIIALGGGSVLDSAKGLVFFLSQNATSFMDLAGAEAFSRGKKPPFIAIPTTAGTGSESTTVAVIADEARHLKLEFISRFLAPDTAILDPRLTVTLPAAITASTALDALSHAIEAYTCIQKNPLSDAYALAAIQLIFDHLEKTLNHPSDQDCRHALLCASTMAGAAFSNSMVGLVHAIGHSLGGLCKVPHAHAMTMLLPAVMAYNCDTCTTVYAALYDHLARDAAGSSAAEKAAKLVQLVTAYITRIAAKAGLPQRLHQAGVKPDSFEQVALNAVNDGAIVLNPKHAGIKDIIQILETIS